jgi:hypothetical protein
MTAELDDFADVLNDEPAPDQGPKYKAVPIHNYKWGRAEKTAAEWMQEFAKAEKANVRPGFPKGNPLFVRWKVGEPFSDKQYEWLRDKWTDILDLSRSALRLRHDAEDRGADPAELEAIDADIIVIETKAGSGKYRSYRADQKSVNAGKRPDGELIGGHKFKETLGGVMFDVPVMRWKAFVEVLAERKGWAFDAAKKKFQQNPGAFIHHGSGLWSGKGSKVRNPAEADLEKAKTEIPEKEQTAKQALWWTLFSELPPNKYKAGDSGDYPEIQAHIMASQERLAAFAEIRSFAQSPRVAKLGFPAAVRYYWENRNNLCDGYSKGNGPAVKLPSGLVIGRLWYDRQTFRNFNEMTFANIKALYAERGYPAELITNAVKAAEKAGDVVVSGDRKSVTGANVIAARAREEFKKLDAEVQAEWDRAERKRKAGLEAIREREAAETREQAEMEERAQRKLRIQGKLDKLLDTHNSRLCDELRNMPYIEQESEVVDWIRETLRPMLGDLGNGSEVLRVMNRATELGLITRDEYGHRGGYRNPRRIGCIDFLQDESEHQEALNDMWEVAFSGINPIDGTPMQLQ